MTPAFPPGRIKMKEQTIAAGVTRARVSLPTGPAADTLMGRRSDAPLTPSAASLTGAWGTTIFISSGRILRCTGYRSYSLASGHRHQFVQKPGDSGMMREAGNERAHAA